MKAATRRRKIIRMRKEFNRKVNIVTEIISNFWSRYYAIIISCGILLFTITASSLITIGIMNYKQSHSVWNLNRDKMYVAYYVRYGDTLWSISEDMMTVNPEYRDIRDYMWEVRQINGVYGDLKAGQTIMLPYYTVSDPDKVEIYNQYQLTPIVEPPVMELSAE